MSARAIVLALAACAPVQDRDPLTFAPAGLDVTLDAGLPVILEDESRRHAPPAEVLRRRIYIVEHHLYRWFSAPRVAVRPGQFRALPYIGLPRLSADYVSLQGWPPPQAGDRFVLFDDDGRRAVVEAIADSCPPGQQDCITCADADPLRRHWARLVDEPVDLAKFIFALGPFASDEVLPAPRALGGEAVARGRWLLDPIADLDGDGEADLVRATRDCRASSPCVPPESWRLYEGRWYAEPPKPRSAPPAMHLLRPDLWTSRGRTHWIDFDDQPGSGKKVLASAFDGDRPRPGDYQIISPAGILGRIRFDPKYRSKWWGAFEGFLVGDPPRLSGENVLLAGPLTAGTGIRTVSMPRRPAYARAWDPNRPAIEVELELTDGRRWTVTSRPCAQVAGDGTEIGLCFETRLDRDDGFIHRHITAFLNIVHGLQVDVCGDLPAGSSRLPP